MLRQTNYTRKVAESACVQQPIRKCSLLRHQVRNETRIRVPHCLWPEDAVAAAFAVVAFEVDGAALEAGLGEQFAEFGDGPDAPGVGESVFPGGAFFELKVDAAFAAAGDGVEGFLFPDVLEPAAASRVDLAAFFHHFGGFVAAVGVHEEDAVGAEGLVDGAEVREHGLAGHEDPVGEVHGEDGVDAGAFLAGREDVAGEELDALLGGGVELGDVVALAPGKRGLMEVEGDGVVVGVALDEFAGGDGGAAEVFADAAEGTLAELLELRGDEVDLVVGALDGLDVEEELVGVLAGELGESLPALGGGHGRRR